MNIENKIKVWSTGRQKEPWEEKFDYECLMNSVQDLTADLKGDLDGVLNRFESLLKTPQVLQRISPHDQIELQALLIRLREIRNESKDQKTISKRSASDSRKPSSSGVGRIRNAADDRTRTKNRKSPVRNRSRD